MRLLQDRKGIKDKLVVPYQSALAVSEYIQK